MFFSYGRQSYGGLPVYQLAPFSISVDDTLSITEFLSKALDLSSISVHDNITLSEYLNKTLNINLSVHDHITLSELVNNSLGLGINVGDSISLSETLLTGGNMFADIFDTITLSEAVQSQMSDLEILPIDTITISEDIERTLISFASVSDTLSFSEYISITSQKYLPQTQRMTPKGSSRIQDRIGKVNNEDIRGGATVNSFMGKIN